jgi:hypothetical protein
MMRCWKRSPLGKPQRFHRCRWLTWDRLHPLLWTSIWRHRRRLHPLQRQLLAVLHLHRRPWSSGPSLPVEDSLLALLMPREAASSSPAITQMGWPHLPPPIGGPNGPRSGRHVGHMGGGDGVRRGKPWCGRALQWHGRRSAHQSQCSARHLAGRPGAHALALGAGTAPDLAPGQAAGRARAWRGPTAALGVASTAAGLAAGSWERSVRLPTRRPARPPPGARARRPGAVHTRRARGSTGRRGRSTRTHRPRSWALAASVLGAGGFGPLGDGGMARDLLAAAAGKAPVGDGGWGRLGLETLAAPI